MLPIQTYVPYRGVKEGLFYTGQVHISCANNVTLPARQVRCAGEAVRRAPPVSAGGCRRAPYVYAARSTS